MSSSLANGGTLINISFLVNVSTVEDICVLVDIRLLVNVSSLIDVRMLINVSLLIDIANAVSVAALGDFCALIDSGGSFTAVRDWCIRNISGCFLPDVRTLVNDATLAVGITRYCPGP